MPKLPRGFVRDVRIRWALEEAGLPYRVESVPFRDRSEAHFARQPFGQVPFLTDNGETVFESGAMLLHLGERSDKLMPTDPQARGKVIQWLFAALNSVEMASLPWTLYKFTEDTVETPGRKLMDRFLATRLEHMNQVLADCEWLAGDFSVADIAMADVLRLVARFDGLDENPAIRDYVERATARPAFIKAHTDQLAHFAAAD